MAKSPIPTELFQQYSVGQPKKNTVLELQSLSNHVYRIETTAGQFVVKEYLYQNEHVITNLHLVQDKFRSQGIRIPKVIKNINGSTVTIIGQQRFELTEYISNVPLRVPDKALLRHAGQLLAVMHNSPKSQFISLPSFNFAQIVSNVARRTTQFLSEYGKLRKQVPGNMATRLANLHELIERTKDNREAILNGQKPFTFPNTDFVPTHGDLSLSNILKSAVDGSLYLVDWDFAQLRPPAWDLQWSISQLCRKKELFPGIAEINFSIAIEFLKAYAETAPFSKHLCEELVEVADFNFSVHWLDFTLSRVLLGDFRALAVIPTDSKVALFWKDNLPQYRDYLLNHVANLATN